MKSFGIQCLKPKMELYNDNPTIANDKADKLLQDMMHLKDNMVENIESLIQRDGKIEIMAEKAKQLSTVSNSYKTKSKKLKVKERNKRYIMIGVVVGIVVSVFAIVLWAFLRDSNSSSQS